MLRCVFFDRDGVVNASPGAGYVERVDDFHVLPGFIKAAKVAMEKGYSLAVATNQRGVARGIISPEKLDQIHAFMIEELNNHGIELLGIYCCIHERNTCTCRKPQPGLLLEAALQHKIDLSRSWMVGDHETDVEAGRNAGCRTIRVGPGDHATLATHTVENMDALAAWLQRILV